MRIWPYSRFLTLAFLSFVMLLLSVPTWTQSGATLKGALVDRSEAAITGAAVSLYSEHKVGQTVSDAAGRFEFRDLPPGTYRLEAEHFGFKTAIVQPLHIKSGDAEVPLGTITMDLGMTESCGWHSSVSYEERKPGAVNLVGRIQLVGPEPEPAVLWPSPSKPAASWPYVPFSQATVEVLKPGGDQVIASAHPDDQGKFEFTGLEVGEYVLKARYKGCQDGLTETFQITKEDVADVTIPLVALGRVDVCM